MIPHICFFISAFCIYAGDEIYSVPKYKILTSQSFLSKVYRHEFTKFWLLVFQMRSPMPSFFFFRNFSCFVQEGRGFIFGDRIFLPGYISRCMFFFFIVSIEFSDIFQSEASKIS